MTDTKPGRPLVFFETHRMARKRASAERLLGTPID
jgi:hypothetical protein